MSRHRSQSFRKQPTQQQQERDERPGSGATAGLVHGVVYEPLIFRSLLSSKWRFSSIQGLKSTSDEGQRPSSPPKVRPAKEGAGQRQVQGQEHTWKERASTSQLLALSKPVVPLRTSSKGQSASRDGPHPAVPIDGKGNATPEQSTPNLRRRKDSISSKSKPKDLSSSVAPPSSPQQASPSSPKSKLKSTGPTRLPPPLTLPSSLGWIAGVQPTPTGVVFRLGPALLPKAELPAKADTAAKPKQALTQPVRPNLPLKGVLKSATGQAVKVEPLSKAELPLNEEHLSKEALPKTDPPSTAESPLQPDSTAKPKPLQKPKLPPKPSQHAPQTATSPKPTCTPILKKPKGATVVKFGDTTIHTVEVYPGRHLTPIGPKQFKTRSGHTYLNPPADTKKGRKVVVEFPPGKLGKLRRHRERQAAMARYWLRTEEEEKVEREKLERRAEEETMRYREEPSSPCPGSPNPEGMAEWSVGLREVDVGEVLKDGAVEVLEVMMNEQIGEALDGEPEEKPLEESGDGINGKSGEALDTSPEAPLKQGCEDTLTPNGTQATGVSARVDSTGSAVLMDNGLGLCMPTQEAESVDKVQEVKSEVQAAETRGVADGEQQEPGVNVLIAGQESGLPSESGDGKVKKAFPEVRTEAP